LTEQSETNRTRTKAVTVLEIGEGELLEVIGVTGYRLTGEEAGDSAIYLMTQHGNQLPATFAQWQVTTDKAFDRERLLGGPVVGPCKLLVKAYYQGSPVNWQVSYKLTKPSAANTTTSAPILLPPTQDAAKSWFVKLQVSSDLKAWDDVAPGQFLGSDTARFFRIQTREAE
jgi:hypothetical protein